MPRDRSKTKPADFVLSGAGAKFMGLVGGTTGLMDGGYSLRRVAGVSAGAVVGAILVAASQGDQLTTAEMRELALSVPLPKFRDGGPIPFVGPAVGMLLDTGLYRGDYAHQWIRSELKNLGVTTWGDLALDDDQLPPERRYKLTVPVADLTISQLVRLPWDYRRVYGLDPDEQPVADAIRASISIPFFFRPATLTSAKGRKSTLVDGGMLSYFPVDTLDRHDGKPPRWPTFGVTVLPKLVEGIGTVVPTLGPLRLLGPSALLERLITTMLIGHDQAYLNQPWVAARTIQVVTLDVGILDFGISKDRLESLYDRGYAAAETFLSTWDWPVYLKRFRGYA